VSRRADGRFLVSAETPSATVESVARVVVLATGGFQANPAILQEHLGAGGARAMCRAARSNRGDGLRIGRELGAALAGPMDRFYGYPMPVLPQPIDHANDSIGLLACTAYYASNAVLVNARGDRFVDEPAAGKMSEVAREIARKAGGECWAVLDGAIRDRVGKRGFGGGLLPPMDLLRNTKKRGAQILEAPTIDALARSLGENGVDAERVARTLEEYNRAAAAKRGPELSPPRSSPADALATPPFYALRLVPGVSMTYGGLRINRRAQLLDADGNVLAGLFAVPGLAGGIYARQYAGALAACGTFGRIAGCEV
jgi:tricarballylate dehydrogenase